MFSEADENQVRETLNSHPLRELLYTTIANLIDAKIHAAFYHSGLGGSSYDPDQVVDYQERLLAAVVDELHNDTP